MKLCEIPGSKYVPKPEISRYCDDHKNENGIWDVLGFYTPQNKRITICDKNIEDYVKKLPEADLEKIGLSRNELILFVRELVRLHEHGHAFLHTAEVGKKWQYNLPSDVDEPVTEFIVRSIIEKMDRDNIWIKVFDELDKNSPGYYKNWSKIKDVLENSDMYYPEFIPLLIGLVRSKEWKNWDEFFNSLKEYLNPKELSLDRKKVITKEISEIAYSSQSVEAIKLLKRVVLSVSNNEEREALLNVIKQVFLKKDFFGKSYNDEYKETFELFLSRTTKARIIRVCNTYSFLLFLIGSFPELKEWIKQQFDLEVIKKVAKKLSERYKLAKNINDKKIIKKGIANLVAVFKVYEYFLWLF